jgi:hypothetical protein
VESQAFLGAGKRRLSGGWMHKIPRRLLRESGHGRTLGFTADCGLGFSVCCGEATKERTRGGSGGGRPIQGRPEEYTDWQALEGWQAEYEGVTAEDCVRSGRKFVCGIAGKSGVRRRRGGMNQNISEKKTERLRSETFIRLKNC